MSVNTADLICAIDQGTTSSRITVYDTSGAIFAYHQHHLVKNAPHPGWMEQDPFDYLVSIETCFATCNSQLREKGRKFSDIKCIGITNQRETVVIWDPTTGLPLCPAIVWCDNRNSDLVDQLVSEYGVNYLQTQSGLPISTYFSATKLLWLRKNNPVVAESLNKCSCLIGTVDTWLIWNMTGQFVTDVTNASRTLLMNIKSLQWDDDLLKFFQVPKQCLPEIRSCCGNFGKLKPRYGDFEGIPITGVIGDQQSALVGNFCEKSGMVKITYGTGCFLLYNTGTNINFSKNGLLTTVAYRYRDDEPPHYAMEGSVASAGFAVEWFQKILGPVFDVYKLAESVKDTDGVYFVPAFTGLLCPYWQPDARATFQGLTTSTTTPHMCRAVVESVAYQVSDVLGAMDEVPSVIRVDGGMSQSDLLLQTQADVVNVKIERGANVESTSKGAGIVAAIGFGFKDIGLLKAEENLRTFMPSSDDAERERKKKMWHKAVQGSMHWVIDK